MRSFLCALILTALACPCFAAEELVTIPTRSGVTLSYLLDQDKAAMPKVVVISFVGGFGAIGLERRAQKGPVKFGPTANFLVRIKGKVPVLVVHHRDDGCRTSPYSGAERLSKKFPLISVSGGDPPQGDPCESMAQHGYVGHEAVIAQAIRNWMLGREFAREIK